MKRRGGGSMSAGDCSHLLRGAWLLCCCQVVLVASSGSKLWEVPLSSPNVSHSVQWEPHCQHHQDKAKITANVPPTLDGTWVSTRCEVRPGPEFLLRSYTFHPTRHLQAIQHYYTDSSCGDPAYSLLIRGKFRLRQASWITLGGTETDHHINRVGIVIHSRSAKQRLASRLPPSCVGVTLSKAVPGKVLELYNTRAGRLCLSALGFSMMELGLVRVETQNFGHGGTVQEMFLGDIHTQWTQRTYHRPTGYQTPLQNVMHHIHPCPVCALVYRSSELRPPALPRGPSPPLSLSGRWVSQHCETRPSVLFLTRDFTFDPETHQWGGIYRHYSDPFCAQPTFTLTASGHYAQGNPSAKISAATEFVFKVTQVQITAFDLATAKLLNSTRPGKCGLTGNWEVGIEQDITTTHGCTALGIKLPHKEYELFKTELDHRKQALLFIGERPTDGSSPDRPQKRPTSFQTPLVQCSGGVGGGQEERLSHKQRLGSHSKQIQLQKSGAERWRGHAMLLALGLVLYTWGCVY
ncbi:protein APCDD1-like [Periophthalmus magnuspinnatus]|nr:protein APCDD1-like [Periophthalmus magnuspinnatus]